MLTEGEAGAGRAAARPAPASGVGLEAAGRPGEGRTCSVCISWLESVTHPAACAVAS